MARPKSKEPYKTYNLIIYERQFRIVENSAKGRKISTADLIRQILDDWINEEKRQARAWQGEED